MSAFDLRSRTTASAILTFDLPGEKVNKFSTDVLAELADILVRLPREARIRGLLIRSGKPDVFIAGADVKEFTQVRAGGRPAGRRARSRRSSSSSPTSRTRPWPRSTAPVSGAEPSWRWPATTALMSDSKKAQIGLPEVRLGIFPAWGGCTRLPRVVGLRRGARPDPDRQVAGRAARPPDRARRRGRPGADLRGLGPPLRPREARRRASRRSRRGPRSSPPRAPGGDSVRPAADLREGARGRDEADRRATTRRRSRPSRSSRRATESPSRSASQSEARHIGLVFGGDVQRNLLGIFFLTEEVKKETGVDGPRGPTPRASRGSACSAPASWAAASRSSARTRVCRRG